MKRSGRLFLLLGVALAVVAFVGVLALGSKGSAPAAAPPPPPMVAVVTTNAEVPFGTALTREMLTIKQVEESQAPPDSYRDPAEVTGMVIRRPVSKGVALTTRDFGAAGTVSGEQVVRALQPGQRAMAVKVDQLTGVGTLIQPGDRVDVILAIQDTEGKFPVVVTSELFPTPKEGVTPKDYFAEMKDVINNTSVKVLVQNVQVLGTLLPSPESATQSNVAAEAEGKDDDEPQAPAADQQQVAILSVTPQQAELVRFAQLDGNLSLTLRAPGDKDAEDAATSGVTLRYLVDRHGVLPPRLIDSDYP